jgi:hypothetical protein
MTATPGTPGWPDPTTGPNQPKTEGGEGMTDTPTGCHAIRTPVMEHAHNPHPPKPQIRRLPFCLFQHAPGGVDVQDLRPLRGRPCGPIPDTDAYPGAPTDPHKKIQTTKNEVDRPRPFQG